MEECRMFLLSLKKITLSRFISFLLVSSLLAGQAGFSFKAYSAPVAVLPVPGTVLQLTPAYKPPLVMGIRIDKNNPMEFDFVLNRGSDVLSMDSLRAETLTMARYFFTALTVPSKDVWVNLSPGESNRIVESAFGGTQMGQDLLKQDYLLKQLTASLMHPESAAGRAYWARIRAAGVESVAAQNGFAKVWIAPRSAQVYETARGAYIIDSRLKVLLEEDIKTNSGSPLNPVVTAAMREIIVPAVEKEINQGKTFANLRQIYNSMILAVWYKQALKESLLSKIYVDRRRTHGVDTGDDSAVERIYQTYLASLKKGVCDKICKEVDPARGRLMRRHYFTGGAIGVEHVGVKRDPQDLTSAQKANLPGDGSVLVHIGAQEAASRPDAPVVENPAAALPLPAESPAKKSIRVAVAQINPTVGDLKGNVRMIRERLAQAKAAGANVMVTPELAITGYPPEDLLLKQHFVDDNRKALFSLLDDTQGITLIVGFVDQDAEGFLYNAAAIIRDGEIVGTYRKKELPNYSVFDEKRYFVGGKDQAEPFLLNGLPFAVNICEDIWIDKDGIYLAQAERGARINLNLSASPYYADKVKDREALLKKRTGQTNGVFVYVNTVGGQDDVVYDGASMVVNADGTIAGRAAQFSEDMMIVDVHGDGTAALVQGTNAALLDGNSEIYQALVLGTRDYFRKNGFKKAVIGISGGIDSALVAQIAVDALGAENVVGIGMPTRFNDAESRSDAALLCKNLGIKYITVPIEDLFKEFEAKLHKIPEIAATGFDVADENIQARIRMAILMYFSNKFNWLLLSTSNKSEASVGYGTLYGDISGGMNPIKDLFKTQVYALARAKERIPRSIIARPPSAALREDQKDTDSLPPYEILDSILERLIVQSHSVAQIAADFDPATVERVAGMVDRNEYKRRQSPPGLKISKHALGKDNRMPITNRYIDRAEVKDEDCRRVGVLGLTGDPFHEGYIHLAKKMMEQLGLDKVIFVPSNQTPDRGKTLANAVERYEMTELGIKGIRGFEASAVEIRRGGDASYTVDTIQELKARFSPDTKMFFLMGSDRPETLPDWHRIDELKNMVTFVVGSRAGYEAQVPPTLKDHVKVVPIPPMDVSGEKIRAMMQGGEDVGAFVPKRVHQYIREREIDKRAAASPALITPPVSASSSAAGVSVNADAAQAKFLPRTYLTSIQLDKAYSAFLAGKRERKTWDLKAPKAPHGGAIMVAAGVESVLASLFSLRYEADFIESLRREGKYSKDFIDYLANFTVTCDIDGLQEGRVITPEIPLLRINASEVELALVGSMIKNRLGFQVAVATKAARIVQAARGDFIDEATLARLAAEYGLTREQVKQARIVLDFGFRRAQGEAAPYASEAAVIGGALKTSNMKAALEHYLEATGTIAHLYVMLYGPKRELEAFRAYVKMFPENAILLIDTYDTLEGAKKAAIVAQELKRQYPNDRNKWLKGVRLDSGKLAPLSRQVRRIFDEAGCPEVKIFASDDLDEEKITELIAAGAIFDGFGVGTNLVTGGAQAYLPLEFVPSDNMRLWRVQDAQGKATSYVKTSPTKTAYVEGDQSIVELLVPYWRNNGMRYFGEEKVVDSRARTMAELARLPEAIKRLSGVDTAFAVRVQDNPLMFDPNTDMALTVDAQKAFGPKGGLPVSGAEEIVPVVRTVNDLIPRGAQRRSATIDKHRKGSVSLASSYKNLPPMTLLTYDMAAQITENWTKPENLLAGHALFTLERLKNYLAKVGAQMLWPDHALLGTMEVELLDGLRPSDYGEIIDKGLEDYSDSYSGFTNNFGEDTGYTLRLKKRGIKRIFIKGLAGDYCVGFTATDAAKAGFEVYVVEDAQRNVGFPPDALEKMYAEYRRLGIKVIKSTDLVAANDHKGVFPAHQLREPITHPIVRYQEGDNVALKEDMYHLTMAQTMFENGEHNRQSTFDYFYRTPPYADMPKVVVAGMRFFLEELRDFRFTDAQIDAIEKRSGIKLTPGFRQYLKDFKFSGTIKAFQEGSVVYGNEPIMTLYGNPLEVMLLETFVLSRHNFVSLDTTNAARIRRDHPGEVLIEDAFEASQGPADLEVSWAAAMAGFDYTTSWDAARRFGIKLADSNTPGLRIGAELATGGKKSSLGGVFKLAKIDHEDRVKASEKEEKSSLAGDKDVVLITDDSGKVLKRITAVSGENIAVGLDLKAVRPRVVVVDHGNILAEYTKALPEALSEAQARCRHELIMNADVIRPELSSQQQRKQTLLIDEARLANAENLPRIARTAQPDGYPQRVAVPDTRVLRKYSFPGYAPLSYTSDNVRSHDYLTHSDGWADPEDIRDVQAAIAAGKRPPMNVYGLEVEYDEKGYPVFARTGLTGRGDLGLYGFNPAATAVVLRENPLENGRVEVLLETRQDGQTALPGRFLTRVKGRGGRIVFSNPRDTAVRALHEETGIQLTDIAVDREEVIYRGPVDDDRNTDQSQVADEVWLFHITDREDAARISKPKPGYRTNDVKWVPIDQVQSPLLYANHGNYIRLAVERIGVNPPAPSDDSVGGVTLNEKLLNLRIRRDGKGPVLPVSQEVWENISIRGLSPVVMGVSEDKFAL